MVWVVSEMSKKISNSDNVNFKKCSHWLKIYIEMKYFTKYNGLRKENMIQQHG